nr:chromosome partitioning protein ParB [Bacteroidia bacterium]
RDGQITMGHARAIINVDDVGVQLKIYDEIITNNLSVRKVEELVRLNSGKKGKGGRPGKPASQGYEYKNIQDRLAGFYETKVELKPGAKGTGKIILSYYSVDDLNRLLDMLEG